MPNYQKAYDWFKKQNEYFVTNHNPGEFKIFHRVLGIQIGVSNTLGQAYDLAMRASIRARVGAEKKFIEIYENRKKTLDSYRPV